MEEKKNRAMDLHSSTVIQLMEEKAQKLLVEQPTTLLNDGPSDKLDEAVELVVEEESKKGTLPDFETDYGKKVSEEVWKEYGVDGEDPTSEDLYFVWLRYLLQ